MRVKLGLFIVGLIAGISAVFLLLKTKPPKSVGEPVWILSTSFFENAFTGSLNTPYESRSEVETISAAKVESGCCGHTFLGLESLNKYFSGYDCTYSIHEGKGQFSHFVLAVWAPRRFSVTQYFAALYEKHPRREGGISYRCRNVLHLSGSNHTVRVKPSGEILSLEVGGPNAFNE